MVRDLTFPKELRLKSAKQIGLLFGSPNSVLCYPILVKFRVEEENCPKLMPRVAFSVPKRAFKSAVVRNRIRRRMKECYRLNWKEKLDPEFLNDVGNLTMMLIYVAKEEKKYNFIQDGVLKMLLRLKKEILSTSNPEKSSEE